MDFDNFINCEKNGNVDVPAAFVGLRILLVDDDVISLSNITSMLEEHSFDVTAVQEAPVALAVLQKLIHKIDLVMVDVNMPEMNYLEFIKSTKLMKDIPIILMSLDMKREMVKEAIIQGACSIFRKQDISSEKLKNVWKHVHRHHKKANQVESLMDNTLVKTKSSETYQDEAEVSKRMRITNEKTQEKSKDTSEKEEDHSLVSNIHIESPEKKRPRLKWTTDIDEKFSKVVCELGENARPKHVLEMMNVTDLTQQQVAYRLKKYRNQKEQDPRVQPATSMNFNEGHNSSVLNPNNCSMNFNEPIPDVYIPQPVEGPFIDPPNPNDYYFSGWNELCEFLELDSENQTVNHYNWLDDVPAHTSSTQDNNSTSTNQNP